MKWLGQYIQDLPSIFRDDVLIERSTSGDAAENPTALHIDFDRTVPGSGTAVHRDIGINLDVNSASLGTSTLKGMDIDVVGATSGTSTATGIDLNVSGADTNIGMQILCEGEHLRLAHNAADYATFTVADTGDLTIATVGDGTTDSDLTLDADGRIFLEPADGKSCRVESTKTSAADAGALLSLSSNDGAALGINHRLGKIGFQGSESSSIIREGASIQAFADAAWSSSVNDTRLEFYTMDGDNGAELSLTLDSDRLATFTSSIVSHNTAASHASSGGGLILRSDDGAALGDDHKLGGIFFQAAEDSSGNYQSGAKINAYADAAWSGSENGTRLEFYTMDGDASSELSLTLDSDKLATFAGGVTVTGALTMGDSVSLTAVQTSGESFVDNDTSIMTSAAIDDKINTKYARSTISFLGQASMLSSGNWVTTGQGGISNHTWNQDMGVNAEENADSTGSLAKQYGHMGVRMPYACTIENISVAIRNASGDRQVTVGLFCGRAADSGSLPDWGTTTATAPILQIHADANNEGGTYQNRPTRAEVAVDVVMAAGDMFYPAIKLTGVTGSGAGDGDNVLASFTVGIKTAIA